MPTSRLIEKSGVRKFLLYQTPSRIRRCSPVSLRMRCSTN
jgi:hypothetical protein